jgi:predicted  nucleic acid-binding Zn-ribbon protein
LEEERARAEQLENEAQRSFEAEEQAARCKDEVDALMEQLNQSKAQVQQLESERTQNASVASDSEIALKSRIQELEAATEAQSAEYQKLKVCLFWVANLNGDNCNDFCAVLLGRVGRNVACS